ncbi:J domain-containing protein [candidate division CSSED10-310 bacterium]|uniref:J domain-containing protein n=1 Tax=candidate division CSSED10-310 bacterium TaxID=2855610 RepID=A0ABV6Z0M6_UNCC1
MVGTLKKTIKPKNRNVYRCLACGTTQNMSRRKYCSVQCRQRLRRCLNQRTGILKALYTRYATFYFNESLIFLDILPQGYDELFSFFFPRSSRLKPADDFCALNEQLGNAWWEEIKRTNKRYRATLHILERATFQNKHLQAIKPVEIREPSGVGRSLTCLKINKAALQSGELPKIIKSAFRAQAMRKHPDHGGDATGFRHIKKAYEQLLHWSENPTYCNRRGFVDKWFYDGRRNYWISPIGKPGQCSE